MAELKNRFLYVKADLWNGFTTEQKAVYDNSIVFVKNGNDGVAIYTQGATFGTLDEAEVRAIIATYGYATKGELESAVKELTNAIADAKKELIGTATTNGDTLGKLEGRIKTIEDSDHVNVINGVSINGTEIELNGKIANIAVDGTYNAESNKVATVSTVTTATSNLKTELVGDATEAGNTLGKLEDRIETIVSDAKAYEVKKLTAEELTALGNENVKEAFKLVDEDGTQAGDIINIYKDSSLESVVMGTGEDDQKLIFTYILANGDKDVVKVDVSKFLAETEFGNGLQVVDHVVSVKKDSTSEEFLTVSENGIKISGVQDAIDTAIENSKGLINFVERTVGESTLTSEFENAGNDGDFVTAGNAVEMLNKLDARLDTLEAAKTGVSSVVGDVDNDFVNVSASAPVEGVVTLTVETTTKDVETATADSNGLATAFDVKSYVDAEVSKAQATATTVVEASTEEESAKYLDVTSKVDETTGATTYTVKVSNVDKAISDAIGDLDSELSASSEYFTKVVITDGKLDTTKSTKANISEAVLTGYSATSTQKYVGIAADDTIKGAFDKVESAWDWDEILTAPAQA